MKLLVSVGSFYPDQTGGPANTVYWMTKGLAGRGVAVTVVTSDRGIARDFPFDKWLATDYGNIIYLTTRHILFPWRVILESLRQLPKFEAVYFTSIFYTLSIVVAPIAVLLGKRVIWSPRGELLPSALVFGKFKKKTVLALVRMLKNKLVFHSTSAEETQAIRQVIGEKTNVVELPLVIDTPQPKSRAPEKCFLYVGRIHPIKGLENLFRALPLSARFTDSGYRLKVVGDAENAHGKQLAQLAGALGLQGKIQFAGRLEGEAKDQAFANAYCTILPSFSENFGAVVVESLSQGTPVIASHGTPWQILGEYGAGIWTGNAPQELARAMDSLLEMKPIEYETCRANALRLVREKFSAEENIEGYIKMFF